MWGWKPHLSVRSRRPRTSPAHWAAAFFAVEEAFFPVEAAFLVAEALFFVEEALFLVEAAVFFVSAEDAVPSPSADEAAVFFR